ncbi:MAG TPA: hypothetical protein VLE74_01775, partial [Candidatus Saccharimonadales bacterium]|nr:hypothetical protein [Candidatus Saccharimonadales bacterium]
KKPPGWSPGGLYPKTVGLFALNSQEPVAWVFVDHHAGRYGIDSFRALVFAEVVDLLLFATTKSDHF